MGKYLIALISFIATVGYAQTDCNLKRDSDGIKVYTCKTEEEKFRLLRAEFELNDISILELKDFLWNVPNYVSWQYNMVESEMISRSGEDEMAYRSVVDAPWPVEDRELVLKVKMEDGPSTTQIFIHSFDYEKSIPADLVRVPFFDASWKILKLDTSLKVTYTLRIDPGGAVPAWLANLAMAEGPFISFKKLKEQLEKK